MPFSKELQKSFTSLAKKNALSHAYLFFGPSEEKLSFARALTNFLENKKWNEPDKILLDAQIIEAADFSGIKQILFQKPIISAKRAVVIKDVNFLSAGEQNALLKIVEEPPASALIILLAPDPNALISTLASRCEKMYFGAGKEMVKIDPAAAELVKEFLRASSKRKSEIIKETIDVDPVRSRPSLGGRSHSLKARATSNGVENSRDLLDNFIKALFFELERDPLKNHRTLKELSKRWSLIKQFNVNKRLQLETALLIGSR